MVNNNKQKEIHLNNKKREKKKQKQRINKAAANGEISLNKGGKHKCKTNEGGRREINKIKNSMTKEKNNNTWSK